MASESGAGRNASASRARGIRWLLALLFFASGAAGLVDQVAWLRYLSLVFGNTTLATATLLAVFMAGLGAGAVLFGRLADRTPRPLTLYALLEVGIGLFAIFSPRFFDGMTAVYVAADQAAGGASGAPWSFALLRIGLAALCLLPPTLLMGGTLPLIVRGLRDLPVSTTERFEAGRDVGSRTVRRIGRDTALLYGANTLGAVCGVAGAGFLTIPLFGLHASLLLSAALNFLAALGAVALSRSTAAGAVSGDRDPLAALAVLPPERLLLAAAVLMGATSLAFEVLWTRILVFYLGSTVYAFSMMLFGFLLGVAIGSLAIGRYVDRLKNPLALLAAVELGIAATAPLSIWLFSTLNDRQIALSEALRPQGFGIAVVAQLLAVLPILLPPTLLMGVSFPLLVRVYSGRGERFRAAGDSPGENDPGAASARIGRDLGELYGANTLGCILGSLGAGFGLIPLLGTQNSLLLVGTLCAAIALAFARRSRAASPASSSGPASPARPANWLSALALATPLLFLALAYLLPADRVILAAGIFGRDRPGDLIHFHEDASAAVAIRHMSSPAGDYLSLELNGVNVAGTSPDLYAVQKMQGHLPLLLGRSRDAHVVHIGFGSGGTAHAVSRHPVREIRIVELSPAVLAASDRYFAAINHGVLADPRVRVEINDGRNFLLASPEQFDAVLSDSIHPRYAGNGSLYSEEYFRLVADRLTPGGVVSMWLPMYTLTPSNFAMIVRAFKNNFPETVVWYEASALNSFTIVTGRKSGGPWDPQALARGFADPAVREALADIGMQTPTDLLACYLSSGPELDAFLGDTPPHVDDLPAVEYESGTLLARDWTWLATFSRLLELRPDEPPAVVLAALPESEHAAMREHWRRQRLLLENHRALLAAGVTPYR